MAQTAGQLRHLLLPVLALFLIVWQLFEQSRADLSVRILETVVWASVIVVGLTFLNNITSFRDLNPANWINNVPALFFALSRAVVVIFVAYYVLAGVWQVDVSSLFTAVGIGALAVSFALQDTLSNLVSGFLLLVDKPFQVGDFIVFRGDWMQVVEVGWRATKLKSSSKLGHFIIPNGILSKDAILNYESATEGYIVRFDDHITFSYNDPPNQVVDVLYEVLHSSDLICNTPAPGVYICNYLDRGIEYRMRFWMDFWDWWPALHQLRANIYYAAKRHGLTMPYPTTMQYRDDMSALQPPDRSTELLERLRTVPVFTSLPERTIERLAQSARLTNYGATERIVRQGQSDEGLYVIHDGAVLLTVSDSSGESHEVARLIPGDIFGEMALLRNDPSPISATAVTDSEVLILDHTAIAILSDEHQRFGLEMNAVIEERQQQLTVALGAELFQIQQSTHNGWIELIRGAS
ncbi:mechanosensitive ion channel [Chloroflexi bacterium TSY]|nr:mechanosensitive ion channel [Chloroflexi bacterium TSY]